VSGQAALVAAALLMVGCAAPPGPPLTTVEHVDLPRFMGDWYVIASIPTFLEKRAYNAVESYRLAEDGTVATTIKADYRIIYLTEDYSQTVIGREKRDYVWIMARTPSIPERDYRDIMASLERQGYDLSQVRKVPQRWE
jgi:apolipoprotein D and lipocalin family protein